MHRSPERSYGVQPLAISKTDNCRKNSTGKSFGAFIGGIDRRNIRKFRKLHGNGSLGTI